MSRSRTITLRLTQAQYDAIVNAIDSEQQGLTDQMGADSGTRAATQQSAVLGRAYDALSTAWHGGATRLDHD